MEEAEETVSKRERHKENREAGKKEEMAGELKKKLLTVAAVVVVAAGAFWLMYRGGATTPSTSTPEEIVPPSEISETDHKRGNKEALVKLVEYGDFQCPACAAYHQIINQIADEFKDNIEVVYRHFPLLNIHRHAQIAAQAAEAAGEQGYFWEMSDILYTRQDDWSTVRDPRSIFIEYADELAMDTKQFEDYMNSAEAKNRVNEDYKSGVAAGISSTPTFYINGEKIENPQGLEPFRAVILSSIEKNKPQPSEASGAGEASPEGEITPQL